MSIVVPRVVTDTGRVRFASIPWHDDHPDRQIDAAVVRLDLGLLFACYGGTGSEPFPPDLLLRAVLFETRRGHHRPADWHRDAHECEPVRWLLRGCAPSRSCWYAFRDRGMRSLPRPAVNGGPMTAAREAP